MSTSAPALLPLFRSDQQLRLLGVLFAGAADELPIGALAERAGVAQATVSREVARLEEHGIVVTRLLGRNRLVSPNWNLRWAKELQSILIQTVGVLGELSRTLANVRGVKEAFVFGSWAARYEGEVGPQPRDVDVLVVGDASLKHVRQILRRIEKGLRIDINPVVVGQDRWNAEKPEPLVEQLRRQPLVAIPVNPT